MAAPTPTPTHSVPPSTSPAPAPYADPTAAYATFMHGVLNEMLHELKAVRKELQDIRRQQHPAPPSAPARKRKRPVPTPPCTLCRLSRTQCVAGHAGEACTRCIRKQVECFGDDEADPPRVRLPPSPEDGPEDAESEPEPAPPAQAWPTQPSSGTYPPTPAKRVPKACAECHARKRKCTGGPNCGARLNGAPGPSARPNSHKATPVRMREPCAECRGRKRRCVHGDGKDDRDDPDVTGEDLAPTDTEPEPERLQVPAPSSSAHTPSDSRSPPPRWHYPAPPAPMPHWSYPEQHRPPYPPHAPGPFMHDRQYPHPHPHPHPHSHPHPPPHPHGLHPHPHPHARLPPAPDMRHPSASASTATDPNHPQPAPQPPSAGPTPAATPAPASASAAPAPAGRKGRACLACRKLKMRCVAPNEDGGPDERCQRCERAGLECVYVDRKRRGPGGVFPAGQEGSGYTPTKDGSGYTPTKDVGYQDSFDAQDARSSKKLKREGSPSAYANGNHSVAAMPPSVNGVPRRMDDERMQQDAARTLEESFAEEDGPDAR